jgi:hypothetical protein
MDFDIPQDLQDYLKVLDQFIIDEILSRRTTIFDSLIIAAKMPGLTGIVAVCRTKSGNRCFARLETGPTRPAIIAIP